MVWTRPKFIDTPSALDQVTGKLLAATMEKGARAAAHIVLPPVRTSLEAAATWSGIILMANLRNQKPLCLIQ